MKWGEPLKCDFIYLHLFFLFSLIYRSNSVQNRIWKSFQSSERFRLWRIWRKKKRVILFLTDGAPSDEKTELIFETIRDRNFELNNSVIILTYGFGNADQAILEDIAKQNTAKYGVPANTSVGDIPVIKYEILELLTTLNPPVENASNAKMTEMTRQFWKISPTKTQQNLVYEQIPPLETTRNINRVWT